MTLTLENGIIDVSKYFTLEFFNDGGYNSQVEGYIHTKVVYDTDKMYQEIEETGKTIYKNKEDFDITDYVEVTSTVNNDGSGYSNEYYNLKSSDIINVNLKWGYTDIVAGSLEYFKEHSSCEFDTNVTSFDINIKDSFEDGSPELLQPVEFDIFEQMDKMGGFKTTNSDGNIYFGVDKNKLEKFQINGYTFRPEGVGMYPKHFYISKNGYDVDTEMNKDGLYFAFAKGKKDKGNGESMLDLSIGDTVTVSISPTRSGLHGKIYDQDKYWIKGTELVITPTRKQYKLKLSK